MADECLQSTEIRAKVRADLEAECQDLSTFLEATQVGMMFSKDRKTIGQEADVDSENWRNQCPFEGQDYQQRREIELSADDGHSSGPGVLMFKPRDL